MDKVINKATVIKSITKGENQNCKFYYVAEDIKYYNNEASVLILHQGSQDNHYKNGKSIWLMDKVTGNNGIYGHENDCYNKDFIPIIAKYKVNSKYDSSLDFADGLIDLSILLQSGNLGHFYKDRKIIIEGKSQGGINAILASNNNVFNHIFAVSPPILGTPMADLDIIFKNIRTPMDLGCYLLNLFITLEQADYQYRLEQFYGLKKVLEDTNRIINKEKITVIGGTIENSIPKIVSEKALSKAYILIKRATMSLDDERIRNLNNDGLVLFDKTLLENYGFEIIEHRNFYHDITSGGQPLLQQKIFEDIKRKIKK